MNTELLVSPKEDPNRREMRGYRARRRFGDRQNPRTTRALDDGRVVGDGASVQIAIHRKKGGCEKEPGYSVAEIITWMMRLPFLFLKSVYRWYTSDFQRSPQYAALKDLFEGSFLSNPWRTLNMAV